MDREGVEGGKGRAGKGGGKGERGASGGDDREGGEGERDEEEKASGEKGKGDGGDWRAPRPPSSLGAPPLKDSREKPKREAGLIAICSSQQHKAITACCSSEGNRSLGKLLRTAGAAVRG